MRETIAQQQELIVEVLQHTNSIDAILDATVIKVPDVKAHTQEIRAKVLRILELEQEIMFDLINKDMPPHG